MKFYNMYKFICKNKNLFLPIVIIILLFVLIDYFMSGSNFTPLQYNIF